MRISPKLNRALKNNSLFCEDTNEEENAKTASLYVQNCESIKSLVLHLMLMFGEDSLKRLKSFLATWLVQLTSLMRCW